MPREDFVQGERINETDVENGGNGFIDFTSKNRAVPHGLRSTFRNWAAEYDYDSDMAEIQLAHKVGNVSTQRNLHRLSR